MALGGLGEHGNGLKSQGDDGSFFLEPNIDESLSRSQVELHVHCAVDC